MFNLTEAGQSDQHTSGRATRAVSTGLAGPREDAVTGATRGVLELAVAAAFLMSAQGAFAEEPAPTPNEAGQTRSRQPVALPAITVRGRANAARTEGTGSYTTGETAAATRLPLSPQDTPQALTVVTRQRMDDQQLNSVQGVLENTVGIAPYQSDSERTSFHSRGFLINNILYDGLPPTIGDIVNGSGIGSLETAFYDRVEVVRGASGLLIGSGNPSAAINLVRKRPTGGFSASASLGAGSWDTYRGTADISTPLTETGRIPARAWLGRSRTDSRTWTAASRRGRRSTASSKQRSHRIRR